MNTTRADVIKIMARINLHFGGVYKNLTKEEKLTLVEDWTRTLARYPLELVEKAADKAMAHCEFAPRLATIVSYIEAMGEAVNGRAAEEAWARLRHDIYEVSLLSPAIRYCDGERAEEARDKVREIFEELPEELKAFVGGTVEAFYGLSCKDEEFYDYEKGRFIRAYSGLKQRAETKAQMSPRLTELVKETFGLNEKKSGTLAIEPKKE